MKKRRMAILLTAGLGLGVLVGESMAGTYIYRDEDGKEVRELPRTERLSREAKTDREDAGKTSRRRGAGERAATVIVEKIEKPSSLEER